MQNCLRRPTKVGAIFFDLFPHHLSSDSAAPAVNDFLINLAWEYYFTRLNLIIVSNINVKDFIISSISRCFSKLNFWYIEHFWTTSFNREVGEFCKHWFAMGFLATLFWWKFGGIFIFDSWDMSASVQVVKVHFCDVSIS